MASVTKELESRPTSGIKNEKQPGGSFSGVQKWLVVSAALFVNPHLRIVFPLLFLRGQGEGEKEKETWAHIDWLPPPRAPTGGN